MTGEGPRKPLEVRKRLPFEPSQRDGRADALRKRLRAFLYLAVALICVSLAGYMNLALREPVTAPQVIFPALGALYFAGRAAMMFLVIR